MATDYFVGIDEVGRGPLAGPVTLAAVAYPKSLGLRVQGLMLRDSKRLTQRQRKRWFDYVQGHPDIFYVTAHVSPTVIDRVNITAAANRAANRVLRRLINQYRLPVRRLYILLDGGLYVDEAMLGTSPAKIRTVIRGDEKYNCIRLASIVAKVTRDRYMKKKHRVFPEYEFHRHKGYGTKAHKEAIEKHGLAKIHRLTFTGQSRIIKPN